MAFENYQYNNKLANEKKNQNYASYLFANCGGGNRKEQFENRTF